MKYLLLLFSFFCLHPAFAQIIDAVAEQPEFQYKRKLRLANKGYFEKENGKYGYFRNGSWILPPIYDSSPNRFEELMVISKDKGYGLIDSSGQIIIPFEFNSIIPIRSAGKKATCFKVRKGKSYGLFSDSGQAILPVKYDFVIKLSSGDFYVGNPTEGYGVISEFGEFIIPLVYSSPLRSYQNYFIAEKDGKCGIINLKGEVKAPFIYQNIVGKIFKRGGKKGLMNAEFQEIIPPIYDDIRMEEDSIFIVSKNTLSGLYNKNLELKIPLQYFQLKRIHPRLFSANKVNSSSRGRGVIDTVGNEIIGFNCNKIRSGPGNLIFATERNQKKTHEWFYSVYNSSGEVIHKTAFIKARKLNEEFGIVQKEKEGKYALLSTEGKLITAFVYDKIYTRYEDERQQEIVIKGERDDSTVTINPNGQEKDDLIVGETIDIRHKEKEQRILKEIAGEWFTLISLGEEKILMKLIIREDLTGERVFYDFNKGDLCTIRQEFNIKFPKYAPDNNYSFIIKLPPHDFTSSCSHFPVSRIPKNQQSRLNYEVGVKKYASGFQLSNYQKGQNIEQKEKYATLLLHKQYAEIAEDIARKTERRKSWLIPKKVFISVADGQVSFCDYDCYNIGSLELKKKKYIFTPAVWADAEVTEVNGRLRDVIYRDPKGKKKKGDLIILKIKDAEQKTVYVFREVDE